MSNLKIVIVLFIIQCIGIFLPNLFSLAVSNSTLEGLWGVENSVTFIICSISILWALIEINSRRDKKIESAISEKLPTTALGSPSAAEGILTGEILEASSVKNTFVNLIDDGGDVRVSTYKEWISHSESGVWEDVCGVAEFYSGRYQKLAAIKSLRGKGRTLRVHVLRHYTHIVNFIILDFDEPNRQSVVYYGWLANDSNSQSTIFRTSDTRTVKMYREQFDNLKKITWTEVPSIKADYPDGFHVLDAQQVGGSWLKSPEEWHIGPPSLVDRQGCWETVSYQKDENGELHASSLAVLRIFFDSRSIRISGEVFALVRFSKRIFHAHVDATYDLNSLFFTFSFVGESDKGMCHYKFWRHEGGRKICVGAFGGTAHLRSQTALGIFSPNAIDTASYDQSKVRERATAIIEEFGRIDPNGELKSGPPNEMSP
mmetsp:Transcript_24358/g.45367  ORF Transcript_24358/g.45367 Transcript_24358/m.45367 type:complete len:429 (+) Transcript_24358:290-1576(+)|eukprot:CAMPEP_0184410638 /NCGR_PEP_ID=MMETSP0738-20130409/5059_1 /TAXON_ID=385413 /ORGANISM="Thalassiosira miniscula, Strain CCMP1093" /LENGTH=428 /DNA_ID=CAMNT_0026768703 /DNA_START=275 /DNA_END=1561 /DNA_ORIENTATION=-